MKYLKLFENFYIEDFINELKEVSEMYLAYLLDNDNIKVSVYTYEDSCVAIEVHTDNHQNIRWIDVKDHLIPFIEIINKKYKLVPAFGPYDPEHTEDKLDDDQLVLLWDLNYERTPFTIEELKSHPIEEISGISIYVKYNNEI
jgi:hypothetical protein